MPKVYSIFPKIMRHSCNPLKAARAKFRGLSDQSNSAPHKINAKSFLPKAENMKSSLLKKKKRFEEGEMSEQKQRSERFTEALGEEIDTAFKKLAS